VRSKASCRRRLANFGELVFCMDDRQEDVFEIARRYSDSVEIDGAPWQAPRDKRFRRSRPQTRSTD
jgi:hypothetical protein